MYWNLKTGPNATLPTKILTWSEIVLNPGLPGKRSSTKRLSHSTAVEHEIYSELYKKIQVVRRSKHTPSRL